MALTTYTELKAAVASWTKRDDLVAIIPDFITLAEERIWNKLRSKALMKDLSIAYSGGATTATLPTDCISVVSLVNTSAGRAGLVDVVNPDAYADLQAYTYKQDATHTYAMVTGRQVIFVAAASAAGTLSGRYLAKEPALSVSNSSNQVLAWYPSLYLFGALVELADHTKDDAAFSKHMARFDLAMADANSQAAYTGERFYRPTSFGGMTVV
jgi:hypothetical protein